MEALEILYMTGRIVKVFSLNKADIEMVIAKHFGAKEWDVKVFIDEDREYGTKSIGATVELPQGSSVEVGE